MPGLPDAGGVQEDDGEEVMQALVSLPSSLELTITLRFSLKMFTYLSHIY